MLKDVDFRLTLFCASLQDPFLSIKAWTRTKEALRNRLPVTANDSLSNHLFKKNPELVCLSLFLDFERMLSKRFKCFSNVLGLIWFPI